MVHIRNAAIGFALFPLFQDCVFAVTIFENDLQGWEAAVENEITLIDFESATGSLNGDEFSDLPGGPVFSLIDGDGLFSDSIATDQISPISGVNVFGPKRSGSIEGVVRLTFSTPVLAIGAFFLDVEADFASTGFGTTLDAPLPNVPFSSRQGQGAESFLGFVADGPLGAVEIHFATSPNIDGIVIDDLRYAVPEPHAFTLLLFGALFSILVAPRSLTQLS